MKKINIYKAITACTFASAVLISMPSCTDGFQEANRPGTGASQLSNLFFPRTDGERGFP